MCYTLFLRSRGTARYVWTRMGRCSASRHEPYLPDGNCFQVALLPSQTSPMPCQTRCERWSLRDGIAHNPPVSLPMSGDGPSSHVVHRPRVSHEQRPSGRVTKRAGACLGRIWPPCPQCWLPPHRPRSMTGSETKPAARLSGALTGRDLRLGERRDERGCSGREAGDRSPGRRQRTPGSH